MNGHCLINNVCDFTTKTSWHDFIYCSKTTCSAGNRNYTAVITAKPRLRSFQFLVALTYHTSAEESLSPY